MLSNLNFLVCEVNFVTYTTYDAKDNLLQTKRQAKKEKENRCVSFYLSLLIQYYNINRNMVRIHLTSDRFI